MKSNTEQIYDNVNTSRRVVKTIVTSSKKKNIQTRINRIIGQLNGIKNMIDEDKYCNDILTQLLAINKSIKRPKYNNDLRNSIILESKKVYF